MTTERSQISQAEKPSTRLAVNTPVVVLTHTDPLRYEYGRILNDRPHTLRSPHDYFVRQGVGNCTADVWVPFNRLYLYTKLSVEAHRNVFHRDRVERMIELIRSVARDTLPQSVVDDIEYTAGSPGHALAYQHTRLVCSPKIVDKFDVGRCDERAGWTVWYGDSRAIGDAAGDEEGVKLFLSTLHNLLLNKACQATFPEEP